MSSVLAETLSGHLGRQLLHWAGSQTDLWYLLYRCVTLVQKIHEPLERGVAVLDNFLTLEEEEAGGLGGYYAVGVLPNNIHLCHQNQQQENVQRPEGHPNALHNLFFLGEFIYLYFFRVFYIYELVKIIFHFPSRIISLSIHFAEAEKFNKTTKCKVNMFTISKEILHFASLKNHPSHKTLCV